MAYIDKGNLLAAFYGPDELLRFKLERHPFGHLNVTSGNIVACDPLVQPDRRPYIRTIPPGRYLVEWLGRDRPALLVLWLHDRLTLKPNALRWEMALLAGQSLDDLAENELFGYPVDAGLGCFMDQDAAKAMNERNEKEFEKPDYISYYDDVLADELGDALALDHYPLGAGSSSNAAICQSGWGDGTYPSYWGIDETGTPAMPLS